VTVHISKPSEDKAKLFFLPYTESHFPHLARNMIMIVDIQSQHLLSTMSKPPLGTFHDLASSREQIEGMAWKYLWAAFNLFSSLT
jgi:hypothetical protein